MFQKTSGTETETGVMVPSRKGLVSLLQIFVGEPFCYFNVSDTETGRKNNDFPSRIFCLTVPQNFVEEPFSTVFVVFMYRRNCFKKFCYRDRVYH